MKKKIVFFLVIFFCGCSNKSHQVERENKVNNKSFLSIPDSLKYLIPVLDSVLERDQLYRKLNNPSLLNENLAEQNRIDFHNIEVVSKILDRHGWLSVREIGVKGFLAIGTVMIHADTVTKKKYYNSLPAALQNGKISYETFSLYEDKLNLQTNHFQYYGTQIIIFNGKAVLYPVDNPDSLDSRRKQIFLPPINVYLRQFQTSFNSSDYKKMLPELVKKFKINTQKSFHLDLPFLKAIHERNKI